MADVWGTEETVHANARFTPKGSAPNRDHPLTYGDQTVLLLLQDCSQSNLYLSIRCQSDAIPVGIGILVCRTDVQTFSECLKMCSTRWCFSCLPMKGIVKTNTEVLVGRGGLEPPTSRLSGVRSNHLSYRPILYGPKLLPSALQKAWWSLGGSNS